jgi:hypothetical protein
MKTRLAEIAASRCVLLEKIEYQRKEMADISAALEKPAQIVDAGISTLGFLRRHPTLTTVSLTAILAYFRHAIPVLSFIIPPVFQYALKKFNSNSRSIDNPSKLESIN